MSKRKTDFRAIRSLRDRAMDRAELRLPSSPRVSAGGATSAPIKDVDQETARLVREYLETHKANRL